MPYGNEHAPHNSQTSTAKDTLVTGALGEYQVAAEASIRPASVADLCLPLDALPACAAPEQVTTCLAVDGSRQETPIAQDGVRNLTMAYVRVGIVRLALDTMRQLAAMRHVPPREEYASRTAHALNYALPGVGICVGGLDPVDSWRLANTRLLERVRVSDTSLPHPTGDALSLAEMLLLLHGDEPGRPAQEIGVRRCPVCGERDEYGAAIGYTGLGGGACTACGAELYLYDVLELDEVLMQNGRENALNAVMNALERLALAALIELARRADPATLGQTLIVADGPLAAMSAIQRLNDPMRRYLDEVATELAAAGHRPLLLVGVEKGGNFAEYGETIADLIEPGHVMRLTNDFVSRHITGRHGRAYGVGHMYGRRFFYRRLDGQLLTITVPAAAGVLPWSTDPASEAWESYPSMRTTLEVLESLTDRNYRNAVQPLTRAHEVASIGLSADTVLSVLAQQHLGIDQNTRLRVVR